MGTKSGDKDYEVVTVIVYFRYLQISKYYHFNVRVHKRKNKK